MKIYEYNGTDKNVPVLGFCVSSDLITEHGNLKATLRIVEAIANTQRLNRVLSNFDKEVDCTVLNELLISAITGAPFKRKNDYLTLVRELWGWNDILYSLEPEICVELHYDITMLALGMKPEPDDWDKCADKIYSYSSGQTDEI
ncbi:MAG: hypothetical protein GX102_08780 [Porphyromonadaceae bacterium]|nr:hypothetical protein [Porphyromonadaceae bacterium]